MVSVESMGRGPKQTPLSTQRTSGVTQPSAAETAPDAHLLQTVTELGHLMTNLRSAPLNASESHVWQHAGGQTNLEFLAGGGARITLRTGVSKVMSLMVSAHSATSVKVDGRSLTKSDEARVLAVMREAVGHLTAASKPDAGPSSAPSGAHDVASCTPRSSAPETLALLEGEAVYVADTPGQPGALLSYPGVDSCMSMTIVTRDPVSGTTGRVGAHFGRLPLPSGEGPGETLEKMLALVPPGGEIQRVLLMGENSGWIRRDENDPGLPDLMLVANRLIYDSETFEPKVPGAAVELFDRPENAGAITIELHGDGRVAVKEASSGRLLPSNINRWK